MSLISITTESLAAQLGKSEIPDSFLLVAKNSVLGLSAQEIADILGVDKTAVEEIEQDEDYRDVRLLVAAHHNESSINRDLSWDELERLALNNLVKRVNSGNLDTDTNLRIAALANRATRRHLPTNHTLDASTSGGRVGITLTKRVIERLTNSGAERETTEQVSFRHGAISNPSFADIDNALGVTNRAKIAGNLSFKVSEPEPKEDFDLSDLDALLEESMRKRDK